MSNVKKHQIINYTTERGAHYPIVDISYQLFGKPLHAAPIVLVNHALTGNSTVIGENGWWNNVIGKNKTIDTNRYTVLAIDVPGNGYYNEIIEKFEDFKAIDIARLFLHLIKDLKIKKLHTIIGGSIGGSIAWEMVVLAPELSDFIIPIASNWKSTDWIIAHNFVQNNILLHSNKPLEIARQMAMLFYRTPPSFKQKFNHQFDTDFNGYKVESWLNYHGKALCKRFQLKAYQMMNNLLSTVDITNDKSFKKAVQPIRSKIIQIGIDTDLFFLAEDNIKTSKLLNEIGLDNQYHEIKSIHGHDAFLIEYEQLIQLLKPIFK